MFSLKGKVLSIPRSKPAPRSKSMPRSKSKPDIHSIPVSCPIAAKCPCPVTIPLIFHPQPKHCSPLIHNVTFLQVVTRWLHSALQSHAPWQPEVTHSWRSITHYQFPFISYPFSITYACFNTPDPHHHRLVNPRSHDSSVSYYYKSNAIPVLYLSSDID